MPRVTYADRFTALLARPLSKRDRQFCESLQHFYKSKGRLSSGRARCVRELEDRYSAAKLAEAAKRGGTTLKRLQAISERVEDNQWASQFVMSLMQQVQTGRELSPRQVDILEKIERENSDEAREKSATWGTDYATPNDIGISPRDRAIIAARYYQSTSYFQTVVAKVLDGGVPTQKQYRKMVENKYAQKVIDASLSAPKYSVGSFVALRAAAPWKARKVAGNNPCVVIQTNAAAITSAAKGAKQYKLLPVGTAAPIIVEERHIKIARKLKYTFQSGCGHPKLNEWDSRS